jgi:hypothetical protein
VVCFVMVAGKLGYPCFPYFPYNRFPYFPYWQEKHPGPETHILRLSQFLCYWKATMRARAQDTSQCDKGLFTTEVRRGTGKRPGHNSPQRSQRTQRRIGKRIRQTDEDGNAGPSTAPEAGYARDDKSRRAGCEEGGFIRRGRRVLHDRLGGRGNEWRDA